MPLGSFVYSVCTEGYPYTTDDERYPKNLGFERVEILSP